MPAETATEPSGQASRQAQNSRTLFFVGLAAVGGTCAYFGFTASVSDPLHLYEGLVILLLAALPGLIWAKAGGRGLPLFEVLMLTTANSYAMPILTGHEQLRMFPDVLITNAGFAVVLFQTVAVVSYYSIKGHPGRSSFFTAEVLTRDIHRFIGYGLTITTIYTYLSTFYDLFPNDLVGILRAVFYGIGLVSAFVQAQRWGSGDLSGSERALFLLNLVIQIVIQFSTLFLVGGVSLIVLTLVGYVSGSRRLPFVAVILVLLLTALLHSGKSVMRVRYWDIDGNHHQPSITELPSFFTEWVEAAIDPGESAGDKKMTSRLLERTSLVHILCLVMSNTPDRLPYLDGLTYADIPGQFVPRFFWPGKPLGHVSTYTLSIYYGLQREEDTAKTTIGFGTLSEAYANFGLFGVALVAAFYGVLYKSIQSLSVNSPLLSYAGLLQIVVLAWSFQTEYPMSMWLSSMFQACVAIMSLPLVVRRFFG